jgi:hypothetical protein
MIATSFRNLTQPAQPGAWYPLKIAFSAKVAPFQFHTTTTIFCLIENEVQKPLVLEVIGRDTNGN